MKQKRGMGELIFDSANGVFMGLLSLSAVYPLLYILLASLSDSGELLKHRGLLFAPIGFSLEAYSLVFQNPMIAIGYRNTLVILIVGTFINITMTAFGAYGLSRKNVLLKKPILLMIVFTMFFSGGLIPAYMVVRDLHMLNTLWSIIIPSAVNAYNLIVMRTFFLSLPDSIEESAKMDGANDFTVLFRIILPLSMPIVAVMILFYGVGHWNAFFNALIYVRDRNLYPLQLVLRDILINNSTDNMSADAMSMDKLAISESIKYATIIIATAPILFMYPFLQKYFVQGVMIGAIKE
ncbi:MAG: binding-protein-dependent transport system inner rane component [Paenibacillaceae bacterium]|nr:binding-protein-dependent transport system inner rane component [Paenibacillaceae bacterium]